MKKTLLYQILFFCLILCLKTYSQEQILVQKEWLSSTGTLDTIPYSATAMDSHGNLIVVGNTLYDGQVNNILVTKYDDEGAIIWERQINGQDNGKDFGTALYIDSDNNIFVTGVIFSDVTNYDYIIAKYAPNGNLYWTKLFNGAGNNYDLPVAITGNSNYCYVTGTSFSSTSLTDFATLQLNADDGTINWVRTYNYSNGYELPVGLVLDSIGNLFVTGASASSFNNWDIATIEYDATGDTININRSQNSINGFDKPFDIKKDYNGNIYVVGRTLTSSNTYDIKLLKFNSNLNLQWIRNFDGFSSDDEPSKIQVDLQGNIVIVGYTKLDNKRKILTVKYDTNGNLLWQKVADFTNSGGNNTATAVAIAPTGTVTVVGEYKYGVNSDVFVLNYSASGEEEWSTQFENEGENHVAAINLDSTGNVYVNTSLVNNTVMQNGIIKYVTLKKPYYNVLSNTGKPLFSNNQFIVRFGNHVVNKEAIDNNGKPQDALFGTLERFVIPAVATEIKAALRTTKDIHLIKIFPYDLSTDSIDINNNGYPVKVPEFYCTFVMLLPDSCDIFQKMAALDSLFPSVIFTEPDYFIEGEGEALNGEPIQIASDADANCGPNNQLNLFGNNGINLLEAWAIENGRQHVRVGVFDDGIKWNHQEFATNPNYYSAQDTSFSYVYGWNFIDQPNQSIKQPLPNGSFWTSGTHGTQVASIIAASNGNGGMKGIAGGCIYRDYDVNNTVDLNYNGVKLFAIKTNPSQDWSLMPSPISHLTNAIKSTSTRSNIENFEYNYKLNIQNHSWGINAVNTPNLFSQTNIQLLNEAVHYVNRLGVTVVSSRGNLANQTFQVPACLDTTWMLCVSATGNNGNYLETQISGFDTLLGSSFGPQVDIAAPGGSNVIGASPTQNDDYETFQATSAAAPHATGVAALLMSYLNNPNDPLDENNLVPEDIEWIIKNSATDIGAQGNDVYTGKGRLNAGAALQMVAKPYRKLYHFSNSTGVYSSFIVVDTNRVVYLKEPYQINNTTYSNVGYYNVRIFKLEKVINFDLDSSSTIIGIWPQHSQSTWFGLPINDTLDLHERIQIVSHTDSSATVRGYIYQILNNSGQVIGQWPNANQVNNANFAISVLANNILASTKNVNVISLKLYPNPSANNITIESTKNNLKQLVFYNSIGQKVKEILNPKFVSGKINIDIENLFSGFYFVNCVNINGEIETLKFIKSN